MKRLIAIIVMALLTPMNAAAKKDSLVVGFVPAISQLPLAVSAENLAKDKSKYRISIIKYTSYTTLEAALRVGAIDAASLPLPIALSIASDRYERKKCNIKLLGSMHRGGSILVTAKKGELEEMEGKLIGVPGLDSTENMILNKALGALGKRMGLDYKTMGIPFASSLKYLKTGKLDALFLPEPYGTIALKEKAALNTVHEPSLYGHATTVLVADALKLKKERALFIKWFKSLDKSCRLIEGELAKKQEKGLAQMQTAYFDFPREIVAESLAQRKGDLHFRLAPPDEKELSETVKLAWDMKLIMKSIDLTRFIPSDPLIK